LHGIPPYREQLADALADHGMLQNVKTADDRLFTNRESLQRAAAKNLPAGTPRCERNLTPLRDI
jgi:hypothetical protein